MSYFVQFGDRMMVRLITQFILLHMFTCVAAIALVIWFPFSVWSFIQSVRLPSILLKEAEIVSAPLVERYRERQDPKTSSYLCYLQRGLLAVPYLRAESPAGLPSLEIYEHPAIGHGPNGREKIVEVPVRADWNSVFKAAEGRSLPLAVAWLVGQLLLTILVVYIAIRGYWLIKHGPRHRSRRAYR